ncbi:MAG: hypothetical protein IME97_01690, partial [Proteobacteria bacterium]|nr:hypothetical protein [Pseudomonadota bacterium]
TNDSDLVIAIEYSKFFLGGFQVVKGEILAQAENLEKDNKDNDRPYYGNALYEFFIHIKARILY